MWFLLKVQRGEKCMRLTESKIYPLPYCKTRWCENENTAPGAAEIWSFYWKVLVHLMSLQRSKQPNANPLLCAKLKFVEKVSWKLNTFLRHFQTDNPMVPFLYFSLEDLLRWLMEKFVLKDTLEKADTARKLLKIRPKDVNIQKPADSLLQKC